MNNENFVCQVEGCGFVAKNAGGLRLHLYNKHGLSPDYSPIKREKAGAAPSGSVCPVCGGRLRFLDRSKRDEVMAIKSGYNTVCVVCDELVK